MVTQLAQLNLKAPMRHLKAFNMDKQGKGDEVWRQWSKNNNSWNRLFHFLC